MSGEVNISFVLDMQRKLYRWSNEDPDKVFVDLFNLVCDRRTLNEAWRRLARNSGSRTPGTDGMTRHTVERRPGGAAAFLEEIREALRDGTYCPEPVRQRLIPKPGKPGQFRPLGIPTLIDRLVQMALKLILEPIFEADFYPTSYGFRKGRSTHDALVRIQKVLHPTRRGPSVYRYVIEGDIKGCFDAIDHHVMMEGVRRRIGDRKVLRLIFAFLKAGVMIEGTVRHSVTGSPQGGIISPMLSNIYLTAIDERYGRWSMRPREPSINAAARRARDRKQGKTAFYMVRYADDFVVLVDGTREQAEAEKLALAEFLKTELRMELSMEKTGVTDVRERLRLPWLPGGAGQSAPHGALGRQALHTEGQAERPASQDQGQGERHHHRMLSRRSHQQPQSGHRRMEELLPIRHKGISGVQPPRSLDMAARGALAEKKARKSDVADAAPPLSSQCPTHNDFI